MKKSKGQAIYKYLPHSWISFSEQDKSDIKYACEVRNWYTNPIGDINETMMRNDIARRVLSFQKAGGDVDNSLLFESMKDLKFVEPAMKEGMADIICSINPATYYCENCGAVKSYATPEKAPACKAPGCKGLVMKQLKMVYACECGYAEGVRPKAGTDVTYQAKDIEHPFRFYDKKGNKIEMEKQCPLCKNFMRPKNANEPRLFNAFTGNMVNLYNKTYSEVLNRYGNDAGLLIFAKWFDVLTHDDFLKILDDPKNFFEPKTIDENDPKVVALVNQFHMDPKAVVAVLSSDSAQGTNINTLKSKLNLVYQPENLGLRTESVVSDLTEFDTLKNPKEIIELDAAISKCKNVGTIVDESDITDLLKQMHIKHIQVSESVQIVNYSFGYTRLRQWPSLDSSRTLGLKGFNGEVFTSILETEGILIEMDMVEIINWLKENSLIPEDTCITDELEAKKWIMDKVDSSSINRFDDIPYDETTAVTKVIYSLLHTISHLMIVAAGDQSGISKDSITEMIFPEACSIFIYPTSNEGITLGSISGMFETNLKPFLNKTLFGNETCAFDPVCSDTQNGACLACVYLNEVNCIHFNKDLSRLYLYGGTVKYGSDVIEIKKGFWK